MDEGSVTSRVRMAMRRAVGDPQERHAQRDVDRTGGRRGGKRINGQKRPDVQEQKRGRKMQHKRERGSSKASQLRAVLFLKYSDRQRNAPRQPKGKDNTSPPFPKGERGEIRRAVEKSAKIRSHEKKQDPCIVEHFSSHLA
jgi:hypothetical protein